MGHFPVHSATVNEHGDTPLLLELLRPILVEQGVHLYFFGHDHVMQVIQQDGVTFLGSGAAAKKHSGVNGSYTGLVHYDEQVYKRASLVSPHSRLL